MKLVLKAAAAPAILRLEADAAHPNKLKFKGILVRLDEPSTKPPQGSNGHRIMLPTQAANEQLHTLIGMGVNYHESLAQHDATNKVGVIEKAWIKGNALWISGHVWAGDFPDAEKVLSQPDMGMSMELSHVYVEDKDAPVWALKKFVFTGATFLRKANAAYFDTEAIAAAADSGSTTLFLTTETEMATPAKKNATPTKKVPTAEQQEIAKVAASATTRAMNKTLLPVLASIGETLKALNTKLAASDDGDEDEDEDAAAAAAAVEAAKGKDDGKSGGKDDDDDFDDDDDDDDDDDEDDDVDAALGTDNASGGKTDAADIPTGAPGNLNPDAGKRDGMSSELELKQGPMVAAAQAEAAAYKRKYKATKVKLKAAREENIRLRTRNETAAVTLNATSQQAIRATLPPEATALLKKNGVDAAEIKASGTKLGVDEVDAMFRSLERPVDPETRMAIKMQLTAADLMEPQRRTK